MLHIVLIEPEIPANTGNIARTCVAFNATLHLVRPYGFFLNDKNLKRSGVDYWDHLKLVEHDSFDDLLSSVKNDQCFYFYTRYGVNKPSDISYPKIKDHDVYLVFGKESAGIDKAILKKYKEQTIRIPSSNKVRSLNLSNTVAIACYEVEKQNDYENLCKEEPHKPLF